MNHLKKFNEGFLDKLKSMKNTWKKGNPKDYYADPNNDNAFVLDFLINYILEKIKGHQVVEDDPWVSTDEPSNTWVLKYEFYIDDSELGKWIKKSREGQMSENPGHGYIASLRLPLKEFKQLISEYNEKKIKEDDVVKKIKEWSDPSSNKEYGVFLKDLKDIQIDYIKKVNPEAMKDMPKNENMKYLKTFESFSINESTRFIGKDKLPEVQRILKGEFGLDTEIVDDCCIDFNYNGTDFHIVYDATDLDHMEDEWDEDLGSISWDKGGTDFDDPSSIINIIKHVSNGTYREYLMMGLNESTSGSVDNKNSKAYKSLKKKSEDSGISLTILKQVYKKGMAAWNSGHRPGTPQNAWAMGRVNSFITGSGGARKADSKLWAKAKEQKAKKKKKK